jgi:hypothetical protein
VLIGGVDMTKSLNRRLIALAGLGYVVTYVVAFALGIEVGPSARGITAYYADPGHRAREVVAFFLIAAAALCPVLFAHGVRLVIDEGGPRGSSTGALAFAGGLADGVLILAGNALSRATAFTASDAEFVLEPNTRRLFRDGRILALRLRSVRSHSVHRGVAAAALRSGVLPRRLGWVSILVALLLPLSIGFVGFVAFAIWVLIVSAVMAFRPRGGATLAQSG